MISLSPAAAPVGVLMVQLGTPDAPTPGALRRYLRQFLNDQRVVDYPRWLWGPLLEGVLLITRPPRVAKLYQRIWTDDGSPLLTITRAQADGLQARLGAGYRVVFGMRYGNPSIGSAVAALRAAGIDRVVVLPLFPQFSTSTTASAFDAVWEAAHGKPGVLWQRRPYSVPALRFVPPYPTHPGYIAALAARVRDAVAEHGTPDRYLFTFHGVPRRFVRRGEPYAEHCAATAQALAEALDLPDHAWVQTYQSQFGPEKWLEPATDATLQHLAHDGVRRIVVACPGFVADCLETLDEIGHESEEAFTEAGGEALHLALCVNDHPLFLDALADIARREAAGWAEPAVAPALA